MRQEMRWEIDEEAARQGQDSEDTAPKWSTRLHLILPNLGEVDAQIRIEGSSITLPRRLMPSMRLPGSSA